MQDGSCRCLENSWIGDESVGDRYLCNPPGLGQRRKMALATASKTVGSVMSWLGIDTSVDRTLWISLNTVRRNMMFYYLYEVRNNINGKIYVGVHKTRNLDDGYMGSGKVINRSIEKYGIDNFTKTILEHFDSVEAMYAREKEVVNEEFLERDDTYNLRRGGFGGFDFINKNGLSDYKFASKLGVAKALYLREKFPELEIRRREKQADSLKKNGNNKGWIKTQEIATVAAQSEEAKSKRKLTMNSRNHSVGQKNTQYGTTWIWHEMFGNKKIKKELVVDFIDQGWYKTYKPGYRV
jgi:hypothetical protein